MGVSTLPSFWLEADESEEQKGNVVCFEMLHDAKTFAWSRRKQS